MNKKLLVTIIISASLILIGGAMALIGYFPGGGKAFFETRNNAGKVNSSELVNFTDDALAEFTDCNIDIPYGDFTVVYGDHYGIAMENFVKGTLPSCEVKNGVLLIGNTKEDGNLIDFDFSSQTAKITLTVPQGTAFSSLVLKVEDGNSVLNDITADTFSMESDYGNVEMKNFKASQAVFESESGSLTLDTVNVPQLSLDNEYGNISLSNSSSENLKASAEDGEIALTSVTATKGTFENSYGNIVIKTSVLTAANMELESGDLTVTETEWNGGSVKNEYGAVNISGNLLGVLDILSEDGDVALSVDGAEADYIYNLSAKDNDIRVGAQTYQGSVIAKGTLPNSITVKATYGTISLDFKG